MFSSGTGPCFCFGKLQLFLAWKAPENMRFLGGHKDRVFPEPKKAVFFPAKSWPFSSRKGIAHCNGRGCHSHCNGRGCHSGRCVFGSKNADFLLSKMPPFIARKYSIYINEKVSRNLMFWGSFRMGKSWDFLGQKCGLSPKENRTFSLRKTYTKMFRKSCCLFTHFRKSLSRLKMQSKI